MKRKRKTNPRYELEKHQKYVIIYFEINFQKCSKEMFTKYH